MEQTEIRRGRKAAGRTPSVIQREHIAAAEGRFDDLPDAIGATTMSIILGVSKPTALRIINSGAVKASRIGHVWKVNKDQVVAMRGAAYGNGGK